jgi:type II secretory pathway pseudopilin PulG
LQPLALSMVLRADERGFSLVDMLAVLTIIVILAVVSVPTMLGAMERMRLGQSAREVERELQATKSRAIAKGRTMRIHFDCPSAGEYRTVELLGTQSVPVAADSEADRCDYVKYPFPPPDTDPVTLPNLDGPLRRLDSTVSFTASQTLEFWPDGTAHYDGGAGSPWPMVPVDGTEIRLVRNGVTAVISVNGLGKVLLEQTQ